MRVYLFNPENGVYQGEDFCDSYELEHSEGMTVIAPPEALDGHIPVYDVELGCWRQVTVTRMKGKKNV